MVTLLIILADGRSFRSILPNLDAACDWAELALELCPGTTVHRIA